MSRTMRLRGDEGSAVVEGLWTLQGEQFDDLEIGVESILRDSTARNRRLPPELSNQLALFDQFLSWSVAIAMLLVARKSERSVVGDHSYTILWGNLVSNLMAIRKLVVAGLDIQAKQVLRSHVETCELLLLLTLQPALAAEFAVPEDRKAANEFWHKHVKSGKARKRVWAAISRVGNSEKLAATKEKYATSHGENLALSSHPSYIGAYTACYPESPVVRKNGKFVWPGFFGAVTPNSCDTLGYAMSTMMELVFLKDFPFGDLPEGPVLSYDEKQILCLRVKHGRAVLLTILELLNEPNWQSIALDVRSMLARSN